MNSPCPAGTDLADVLSLVALPDMPKCQGVPTAAALQVLDDLTASLCRSRPDLVFVTLDSPLQERLIHYLRHWLEQSWWVAAGNGLNFACGDGRRAGNSAKTGLEWAHRMYRDSQDVGHRYLVDGWPQAASLLGGAAVKRLVETLRAARTNHRLSRRSTAPAALASLATARQLCWQARRWDGGWFTSHLFPDSPRNWCPGRRRHRPASWGRLAVARHGQPAAGDSPGRQPASHAPGAGGAAPAAGFAAGRTGRIAAGIRATTSSICGNPSVWITWRFACSSTGIRPRRYCRPRQPRGHPRG